MLAKFMVCFHSLHISFVDPLFWVAQYKLGTKYGHIMLKETTLWSYYA